VNDFDFDRKDLENPQFVAHWKHLTGGKPIKPDDQDYDPSADPKTIEETAHEYGLAQGRKLMRIYQAWKSEQN
jgi:hypothetical protein